MDWAIVIAVIGQIATWITIVLVYNTLREMRNQRKASQKPDLILPKSSVYGYVYGYEGKSDLLIARHWSHDKDVKDERYDYGQSAPIKLYNVGFGVAKNIELKWTVEYDKTLQHIKDYCYQNSVPIILQLDENGLGVIEANFAVDIYHSLSPQIIKHDFLMPVHITTEGLGTSVPSAFRELVSIIAYLKSHYLRRHLNEMSGLQIDIPAMRLDIHYDDLENSHYSKSFDVIFSFGYTTVADEKTVRGVNQLLVGSFEFKSR